MTKRELYIASIELDMVGCPIYEIGKAVILCELKGYTPEQAKEEVLSARKTVTKDQDKSIMSISVPDEWVRDAKEKHPDLSLSQYFRYCTHKLTEDPDDARERATQPKAGRPRKTQAVAA